MKKEKALYRFYKNQGCITNQNIAFGQQYGHILDEQICELGVDVETIRKQLRCDGFYTKQDFCGGIYYAKRRELL